MDNNNFVLCGGTFFSLLANAKTNRRKSTFDSKGYSEDALMFDLVKIYNPNAYLGESFKKDTNNYKRCTVEDCSSFDFSNQELIANFDERIKTRYFEEVKKMNDLLNHFFELKNEPIIKKLVRSILELIKCDDTIDKNKKFYILPDGKPVTKLDMLLSDTFNLSAFILGVFHYIIVNKITNTSGITTYASWYSSPGNNMKYSFKGDIGNNYKDVNLVIDLLDTNSSPECNQENSGTDKNKEENDRNDTFKDQDENKQEFYIYSPRITQNATNISNGNSVFNITIMNK